MAGSGENFARGVTIGLVVGFVIAFIIGCSSGEKFVAIGVAVACAFIGGIIGCAFEK